MANADSTLDVFNWYILSPENKLPKLEQPTTPVAASDNHRYDLYSRSVKEAIRYGERTYGINLVWGDPEAGNNIRFVRKNAAPSGPIKSDELIAIHVKGGGFLKYQSRDWGINLVWAETPSFEWKAMLAEAGKPILTGTPVGLFNMVENDFMFYDPRTYGINLKWLKDKGKYNDSWYKSLTTAVIDVAKNFTVLGLIDRGKQLL